MSNRKPTSFLGNTNKRKKRSAAIIVEPLNKSLKLEKLESLPNSQIPPILEEIVESPDNERNSLDSIDNKPIISDKDLTSKRESDDIKDKPEINLNNSNENNLNENENIPNRIEHNSVKSEDESVKTEGEASEKKLISNKPENQSIQNGEKSDKSATEADENPNKSLNPVNSNYKYSDFYLDAGYANRNNSKDQFYAKDMENNEYYFVDSNKEIYAYETKKVGDKEQRIEYPAKSNDGKLNYIYEHGNPIYPENLDTSEVIFPRDPVTNLEMYLESSDGQVKYAENKFGRQFYRKDENNNEVPISNHIYAKDNGDEIYPKLSNGDEYYLKDEESTTEIGAIKIINGENFEYYARKANGNEFYPRHWLSIQNLGEVPMAQ